MRKTLIASLFLSTVLLPAQTVSKGQGTTLVAHNDSPNGAASADSAAPAANGTIPSHPLRISTGVTAPKLLSEPIVRVSLDDFQTRNLAAEHVIVSFRVDEKGATHNVQLVKSAGQLVDSRVLEAVRNYRFEPAKLDDQSVAMDMQLVVNFEVR